MTSIATNDTCCICEQDRFRCPIQICPAGHCLDIGCLLKLARSTPTDHPILCPYDRSIVDLSTIVYRPDIVTAQGPWVEIARLSVMGRPPLKIVVATTTTAAELASFYVEESENITYLVKSRCESLKGMGFDRHPYIPRFTRLPFADDNELFPNDRIARPGEEGSTIKTYAGSIPSSAFCRVCAPVITSIPTTSLLDTTPASSFRMRVLRQEIIQNCNNLGHTDPDFAALVDTRVIEINYDVGLGNTLTVRAAPDWVDRPMECHGTSSWKAKEPLPVGTEYKICRNGVWEEGANRVAGTEDPARPLTFPL